MKLLLTSTGLDNPIGNTEERAAVCEACRGMGIPDEQMQWPE